LNLRSILDELFNVVFQSDADIYVSRPRLTCSGLNMLISCLILRQRILRGDESFVLRSQWDACRITGWGPKRADFGERAAPFRRDVRGTAGCGSVRRRRPLVRIAGPDALGPRRFGKRPADCFSDLVFERVSGRDWRAGRETVELRRSGERRCAGSGASIGGKRVGGLVLEQAATMSLMDC